MPSWKTKLCFVRRTWKTRFVAYFKVLSKMTGRTDENQDQHHSPSLHGENRISGTSRIKQGFWAHCCEVRKVSNSYKPHRRVFLTDKPKMLEYNVGNMYRWGTSHCPYSCVNASIAAKNSSQGMDICMALFFFTHWDKHTTSHLISISSA